ncbi:hypothetical protein PITCH_A1310003 [uncultured Desulfobacterium sp.]|uniref:Uncharacterized protein n=1 Tax=uncultured Desulfobacterium sp. TaxID=201089 RepID=A0A445MS77_9BACT|nr:hypothetical protein PITCH_A1310003 [uncultured Desulfobacterium sp.]
MTWVTLEKESHHVQHSDITKNDDLGFPEKVMLHKSPRKIWGKSSVPVDFGCKEP